MHVQDYGAPVGWRLALADPGAVTAVITQNGNGYEAGAEICLLDGGHFLLESHLDTVADDVRGFLGRTLP